MDRVYFDTSFFIALLENQDGRQEEARRILAYESGNDRFTSELTLNETCSDRVEAIEKAIRSIARVIAIGEAGNKAAALIQSRFGEIHKHQTPPKEPRDRKFRWDAIHIATAQTLKCDRIYAWDGKWNALPKPIKDGLGEIIAPARCPGLPFGPPQEELQEVGPLEVTAESEVEVEASAAPGVEPTLVEPDASTEPQPPAEQSPSAPPVSASPPEPAPLSAPLDAQEQQRQPAEGPPIPPS